MTDPPPPGPAGWAYTGPPETVPPPGYPAGPSPYAPGQYPFQPYAAQPFAAPAGYHPYPVPAWGPAWGPPPPPPRGRWWIAVVVGIAIVVVAGGISAAVLLVPGGRHGPARSLIAPESFGDYQRLHTAAANETESRIQDAALSGGALTEEILAKARIGVYGTGSTPSLIFIGFDASDSSQAAGQLHGAADAVKVNALLAGASIERATEEPPGPLGGDLQCGTTQESGESFTICAWSDYSTLGMTIFDSAIDLGQAGTTTAALRNSAEH